MPWPLDDAVAAHERGDYATALRLYRRLADQGKPSAQYNLGVMSGLFNADNLIA